MKRINELVQIDKQRSFKKSDHIILTKGGYVSFDEMEML